MSQNPYQHPNIKYLKGSLSGKYRYRVGNWRVIYQIDEQTKTVNILLIASRGEVYQ